MICVHSVNRFQNAGIFHFVEYNRIMLTFSNNVHKETKSDLHFLNIGQACGLERIVTELPKEKKTLLVTSII
jgi:hypothetical protein